MRTFTSEDPRRFCPEQPSVQADEPGRPMGTVPLKSTADAHPVVVGDGRSRNRWAPGEALESPLPVGHVSGHQCHAAEHRSPWNEAARVPPRIQSCSFPGLAKCFGSFVRLLARQIFK